MQQGNDMTALNDEMKSPGAIVASVILFMLAPVGMSLVPLLVGASTEAFGLSQKQGGFLAAADYSGIAIAAVATAIWIRKISWRIIALGGILTLIVANGLSVFADSFLEVAAMRFITELGTGLIYSLAIVAIGDTNRPDRYFSIGIGLTVALSVGFFLIIPGLVEVHGLPVIFLAHGLIAVAVLPIIYWLPRQGGGDVGRVESVSIEALTPLFIGMVAFTFFTAAEGGIWAYIERIGNGNGYSPQFVGQVLAVSQVASVLGSICAAVISTRFGRVTPVLFGICIFIAGALMLLGESPLFYIGALCLTQFAYIFVVPFLLLACVELDPTRRFYVLTTGFKLGGFAFGPALVAIFLTGQGFAPVGWVSAAVLVVSLVLILPLVMRLDRTGAPLAQGNVAD